MADTQGFQFTMGVDSNNRKVLGNILGKELENMSLPEFHEFQGRLVKVRRNKRRDMAVWEPNKLHKANAEGGMIFRKGVGEQQPYMSSDTGTYKQGRVQTNMSRGGEFEKGSLSVICAIEAPFPVTSKATAQLNGVVTNPKPIQIVDFDPFLLGNSWQNQVELSFWRGESEIFRSLLEDFTPTTSMTGVLGSSTAVYAQNIYNGHNVMPSVQVIEGGDDFHIRLHLLSEYDMTDANGLGLEITQQVKMHTIELQRNYE